MNVKSIYDEIAQIKENLLQKIKHPYLLKFVNVPDINDEKLVLLYSIFKESNFSYKKLSNYVITTMLVQLALDTHETVSLSHSTDNDETLKSRQLKVLAGDYYSGLYYHLLAKLDDISMIRVLAGAIKSINEHKISVYQKDISSIDQFMQSIRVIESLLIQKVADYVHLPYMKNLASDLCFLSRLMNERENFLKFGVSTFFDVIKKEFFPKERKIMVGEDQFYHLLEYCDIHIQRTRESIEHRLQQLNVNPVLRNKFESLVYNHTILNEKVVEEG